MSFTNEARIGGWPAAAVIVSATLMGMGAVIAILRPEMLIASGSAITEGVRVYAGYLFARNLAIAIFLLALLMVRARSALAIVMALAASVQLLDCILDGWEGRWALVPSVLVIGVALYFGAVRISGRSIWTRAFWGS